MIYIRVQLTLLMLLALAWWCRREAMRRAASYEDRDMLDQSIWWDDLTDWIERVYYPLAAVVGVGGAMLILALVWGWRP